MSPTTGHCTGPLTVDRPSNGSLSLGARWLLARADPAYGTVLHRGPLGSYITDGRLVPAAAIMNSSTDEIAFLANSENRVAVLRSLLDGPHSRHVVAEKTGVTRVTLGRILEELQARRWITQDGQVCDITPLGAWVIEEFTAFGAKMAAERDLRRVSRWFPEVGYEFHVARLAGADITLVSRADASAPITRLVRQFEVGGPVSAFSFAITSQFLDACWRHVMDGSVTWKWVFTADVLDVLRRSPEMARKSREMLDSGGAEYRHFAGEIPYVVIVSRELVNLRLADADGAATALIQSDDEEVRAWAESTMDRYWRAGSPVQADAFTA